MDRGMYFEDVNRTYYPTFAWNSHHIRLGDCFTSLRNRYQSDETHHRIPQTDRQTMCWEPSFRGACWPRAHSFFFFPEDCGETSRAELRVVTSPRDLGREWRWGRTRWRSARAHIHRRPDSKKDGPDTPDPPDRAPRRVGRAQKDQPDERTSDERSIKSNSQSGRDS